MWETSCVQISSDTLRGFGFQTLTVNVLWAELVLIRTALMETRPFQSLFHQCRRSHTWLLFQFLSIDLQIYVPNAQIHTHTHTQGERWQGATQPCIPLCHCTPLNYSVSLKYWYGNHSWLNWQRPERRGAKIYCPFLSASLLHLTDTFWCRQLLILISCPFHTGYTESWKWLPGTEALFAEE